MEIFYAREIDGEYAYLDQEESAHCARVLRHKAGDGIVVVDGLGNRMSCILTDDSPKAAVARILSSTPGWNSHPYHLTMAVCPTKNNERFEWFVEKATELGVDEIVPIIGERSERKIFKTGRSRKIVLSAMKQSLKAALPTVAEPISVKEFLRSGLAPGTAAADIRMICYCFEGETERRSVEDVIMDAPAGSRITVMIGPEGDFSPEEAGLAIESGFLPVHLGPSRLRTETAAITAVAAVYLKFIK